jgi:hypothetical protein
MSSTRFTQREIEEENLIAQSKRQRLNPVRQVHLSRRSFVKSPHPGRNKSPTIHSHTRTFASTQTTFPIELCRAIAQFRTITFCHLQPRDIGGGKFLGITHTFDHAE